MEKPPTHVAFDCPVEVGPKNLENVTEHGMNNNKNMIGYYFRKMLAVAGRTQAIRLDK
jgi:hypothetical protein